MLLYLWIAVAFSPFVACNSIFKDQVPVNRSPDVVYRIGDISLSATVTPQNIKEGLAYIQDNTCVNFIESEEPGENVDLVIQNAPASFPGDRNGYCEIRVIDGQSTFLIGNCISSRHVMVHEVGHFLGMCHTQNRNDWRDFIVPNDSSDNFDVPNCELVPVPAWKYDYGSVMHSLNIANGAKPLNAEFSGTFGQSLRVSFSDYRTINWLFNCDGKCDPKPNCLNGGYTHPRDCSKCMCNKYYTGDFCETPRNPIKLNCENKRDHSWVIDQDKDHSLPKPTLKDDFIERNENMWTLIEAPENTQIQVEVYSIAGVFRNGPCGYTAVEINDGDLNMVGRMFCDNPRFGRPVHNFTAKSNVVGFHFEYVRNSWIEMSAKFTLIGCE